MNGNDNNSIPHELGHTGGLLHPDQQSWLWGMVKGEQYMEYNSSTKNNFMWSNTGEYKLDDKKATNITTTQVKTIQKEYDKGNLNK